MASVGFGKCFFCFSGFMSMGQDGFSDAQKVPFFSVILPRGD
jgi:hypothetical protein